ncbi:hypothetical protein [Agromyces flavus]|uniref:hypothetical protein n=1 Tax=Agromyces flavus TaxID=589382 RepID=UPI00156135D4|nr:hypothetical protein [Agromyces flavus]
MADAVATARDARREAGETAFLQAGALGGGAMDRELVLGSLHVGVEQSKGDEAG